jgi:hypothetical protein
MSYVNHGFAGGLARRFQGSEGMRRKKIKMSEEEYFLVRR